MSNKSMEINAEEISAKMQENLDRTRRFCQILIKKRYTSKEVAEICRIIDCDLDRSGKKSAIYRDRTKIFEGNLKEIVEYCYKEIV
ncbi:MAG: hypothetical protein MUE44_08085 [Oscillatoriaceae cyanobacterium Prado104]|nr:hypothetical protein [Oscillatoriaceae cyanobacterium Prado104]